MIREDVVRTLARAGHHGIRQQVDGTSGAEVVSAIFLMCSQSVDVGLKIGVTRESMRLAILGLYLQVADGEHPQ